MERPITMVLGVCTIILAALVFVAWILARDIAYRALPAVFMCLLMGGINSLRLSTVPFDPPAKKNAPKS